MTEQKLVKVWRVRRDNETQGHSLAITREASKDKLILKLGKQR